ncbi:transcription initiation factor TFIID subunit 9 [Plectosphaerella cucumerina]|uniref:Transcription initiation factor TFIID subunit 9 n=1 Tax=Plectosphaerella cucumerina TaxID=40658 RepID=A0A8K0TNT2_9PEZI|nr:transcription initiation factor TFIID subunit 9 [Plectosphaerella cucumerina]
MSSQTPAPQVNGAPASTQSTSQPATTQTTTGASQSQTTAAASSASQPQSQSTQPTQQAPAQQQQQPGHSPTASASAPRPRDSRMVELLLTSQGVTAYESRVPLLLLDFAYRHTSSILNDAIHLAADPYTSHAGSKPSAGAGPASIPGTGGDATVSASAVKLAIAQRLHYQFRGGGGAGGASKDWLHDFAKERNRTALPKVAPNEWGLRLPSERFVLSGTSWGLKDMWEEAGMEEEDGSDDGSDAGTGRPAQQQTSGAMEGVERTGGDDEDVGGEDVEGGTMEDVFGRQGNEDTEMAG